MSADHLSLPIYTYRFVVCWLVGLTADDLTSKVDGQDRVKDYHFIMETNPKENKALSYLGKNCLTLYLTKGLLLEMCTAPRSMAWFLLDGHLSDIACKFVEQCQLMNVWKWEEALTLRAECLADKTQRLAQSWGSNSASLLVAQSDQEVLKCSHALLLKKPSFFSKLVGVSCMFQKDHLLLSFTVWWMIASWCRGHSNSLWWWKDQRLI